MKNWKQDINKSWLDNKISQKNKCVGCNSTSHLIKLESGAYVCTECLDDLALDQKVIEYDIKKILTEHDVISPQNQAKTLQAIATVILAENNLLNENDLNKLIEKSKEFTYGKHFNFN